MLGGFINARRRDSCKQWEICDFSSWLNALCCIWTACFTDIRKAITKRSGRAPLFILLPALLFVILLLPLMCTKVTMQKEICRWECKKNVVIKTISFNPRNIRRHTQTQLSNYVDYKHILTSQLSDRRKGNVSYHMIACVHTHSASAKHCRLDVSVWS